MLFRILSSKAKFFLSFALLTFSTQVFSSDNDTSPPWASSLNIKFDSNVAIDLQQNLHSDRLSEWHVSQAPVLADIYNNYQQTGRNVAKALISAMYTTPNSPELKMKHYPLKHIFINGWSVRDSEIISNGNALKNKLHFKKEDYPSFIDPSTFMTLRGITESDEGYLNDLINNELLPRYDRNKLDGFEDAKELLKTTQRYDRCAKDELPHHIRNLREKETHAEKLILIYIHKNFEEIIRGLALPQEVDVKTIIINIASYRDMCSACQKIKSDFNPLIKRIKDITNEHSKLPHTSIVPIKIICSGISHIRDQIRPGYSDSYSPIDIKGDKILYMVQNPIYTYALDSKIDSKQYLTIMKNYLPYKEGIW